MGFLSTRIELQRNSSMSDYCVPAPTFDRVVLLIVDAMRTDFVFPTEKRLMHEGQMPKTAAMLEQAVRELLDFYQS